MALSTELIALVLLSFTPGHGEGKGCVQTHRQLDCCFELFLCKLSETKFFSNDHYANVTLDLIVEGLERDFQHRCVIKKLIIKPRDK